AVDRVAGIAPAIAIDQKNRGSSPRSTVATATEIYDYLRILYARAGTPHCPECDGVLTATSPSQAARIVEAEFGAAPFYLLAPLFLPGSKRNVLPAPELLGAIAGELMRDGFARVLVDGVERRLEEFDGATPSQPPTAGARIDLVVDRFAWGKFSRSRVAESIEEAYRRGHGRAAARAKDGGAARTFTKLPACPAGHYAREEELSPRLFSFNHHSGACPRCHGLGVHREASLETLVTDPERPLFRGAMDHRVGKWLRRPRGRVRKVIAAAFADHGYDLELPVSAWEPAAVRLLLDGSGEQIYAARFRAGPPGHRRWATESAWEGLRAVLRRWHERAASAQWRALLEERMGIAPCAACSGGRLRPELLRVRFAGRAIHEVGSMSIRAARDFFANAQLTDRERQVGREVLREIGNRLGFLVDVGLDYLTLDRATETLSGGEAQRIRLATQIGNRLVGVLYVLDEPTVGLHPRDTERLLDSLVALRDLGNSVVVVEHDEHTIRRADHVLDLGPGAGEYGGRIVAAGTPAAIARNPESATGRYLAAAERPRPAGALRRGSGVALSILGAAANNLREIDVRVPAGALTVVTGVSGSGKSTLVMDILARAAARHFHGARALPGKHRAIRGLENFDDVAVIDQTPLGRTPAANPATYTGLWTPIRELFAKLPQAKARGFEKGRFSFNVPGGRCENCEGKGSLLVEMHFLSDVWIPCDVCRGRRFNAETLAIRYRGLTIADVLDLEVQEALSFFENHRPLAPMLRTLADVGLGYLALGQAANTLSGGEAQRVKLAAELGRPRSARMLYLLDEPTTGLHFVDVEKLLPVLQRLVERGDTVVVIEHNLDVIRAADHVIDLGPEGGEAGGMLIAEGTPEAVAATRGSHTGRFLAATGI
ncbi:MAG: excinuclease ABC subunit UvrA, partial [Planctomycetes bacterium]|nr:excinuclease ABC subunit UvrA [Planctomycetota bacterium]